MKKVKVTKRPATIFVLRPARLRMFTVYILLLTLALGAGLLVRFIFSGGTFDLRQVAEDWPMTVAILLGGAALIALVEYPRWTLRVGSDRVEGPSGAFGERLALPLKEIDWARTRRSLASRIKVGNAIYVSSRQRILISPWFFNPQKFKEFLAAIGFDDTEP